MSEETRATEAQAAMAVDNNLETVRDILFGAQARELDKRTQQLEQLIKTSVDRLEKTLESKIKAVEATIDKVVSQQAKEAAATAQKVDARFKDTLEQLQEVDNQGKAALNEFAEQTTADIANLEQQAISWNEDLAKQLDQVYEELKDSKADRSTLAQLFTSMAVAISDDGGKA